MFEDDLLALVDHLELTDVRHCTVDEPASPRPRVRALVMASSEGAVDLNTLDAADRQSIEHWSATSGMQAELCKRGIHGAGERMAREQPALKFLYREIDRLAIGLDQ